MPKAVLNGDRIPCLVSACCIHSRNERERSVFFHVAADPEVPTGNKMKWEEDEATLRDHLQGASEGSVIKAWGCVVASPSIFYPIIKYSKNLPRSLTLPRTMTSKYIFTCVQQKCICHS